MRLNETLEILNNIVEGLSSLLTLTNVWLDVNLLMNIAQHVVLSPETPRLYLSETLLDLTSPHWVLSAAQV